MKTTFILSALLSFGMFMNAQNFSLSARSGDNELDASLNNINANAKADLSFFKKSLSAEFSIGEPRIEKMLAARISPADIFMVFQIAIITKKEPDLVLNTFNSNNSKGWGVIAKEMGIKPGSAEFHALKGKAKNKKGKSEKKVSNSTSKTINQATGNEQQKGNSGGNGKSKGKKK